MGRRGPKFSFPLPGRKSHSKVDKEKASDLAPSTPAILPISVPEWSPRFNDPGSYSKAERLLGTSGLPYRPSSRQTSMPASPGYMTITVSEASFGSEFTDKGSSTAVEDVNLFPAKRPSMSNRPSSTILNNAYSGDDRRQSNCSSISKKLHPRTSNSTMRSHYDAQNSPLYISQQTSDSAVRDRALRKGKPSVAATHDSDLDMDDHGHGHVPSPLSRQLSDDIKKQNRKSKPPRLDLSRLFPKPKATSDTTLLSPNKLVNSPSAMSTTSEYFPRPMTRMPTPDPKGQAKLTKTAKRQQVSPSTLPISTSPVRLHKREQYDNAKINVRRPPRGIQHWFDGIGDESDESSEEEHPPVHAPKPINPPGTHMASAQKNSLTRLLNSATSSQQTLRPHQPSPASRKDQFTYKSSHLDHRLNSPSQFSMQSQSSLVSSKTRDSAFSKSNLQDSSVLSISSSEDEDEDHAPVPSKFAVRASIDIPEDDGDIIIGKAHAFEMRPRHTRRAPSEGKLSIMSTSTNATNATNAATIEVMYSPEPYMPHLFPRSYGSSRRSSHVRQPSVIHEDEDVRPKTSSYRPMSPSSVSIRSARTSTSEPRSRAEQHKLMAVTAEEEALLEMMRQKRAAMAKHSFTEGYKTAIQQEVIRQTTPPDANAHRTSAFLTMETPATSPARVAIPSRKALVGSASPLQIPPRGRPMRSGHDSTLGTSVLRDSSSCDDRESERRALTTPTSHASLAHHLSPPPEFSPLDPFPSSTPTASMASPTTTDHPSPLPSPVTPGLRHGESDVDVKVAGSEPSCNGDNDDLPVLDSGTIEPPSGSIKPNDSRSSQSSTQHQRRRTASSGANMTFDLGPSSFPVPPKSHDLEPLPEADSRPPSISVSTSSFPEPGPKIPMKSFRRTSTLTLTTTANPSPVSRSRHSSIISSRTSSPVSVPDRRSSRLGSMSRGNSINSLNSINSMNSRMRDSVAVGSANTRSSVSEDVLAAWGSLGGV
ncbi:hypothetical protein K505DRAFT_333417 [Melanomma pulvis-pyrius CBS 109.77]|uniref:Uncharacterized protein n=1 Tax=Melanomma pulvis-pyrius CBS 109.77 TaxID=1314802 RepID=A0A6A6XPM5_9PLEO|nr:hypothetical protein K505DRAFT_333417 [Melanomma pulvis-pyrius CBS 109.77]